MIKDLWRKKNQVVAMEHLLENEYKFFGKKLLFLQFKKEETNTGYS